jgi:hypothetical protein
VGARWRLRALRSENHYAAVKGYADEDSHSADSTEAGRRQRMVLDRSARRQGREDRGQTGAVKHLRFRRLQFKRRELFPNLDAAVSKRGRFPGVFRKTATYSKGYIRVFSELFLGSKTALRSEAPFSQGKHGFLVRLFADGLFVMIISSQGI